MTRVCLQKPVLSASPLIVINPFLLKAESESLLVTVTPTPTAQYLMLSAYEEGLEELMLSPS